MDLIKSYNIISPGDLLGLGKYIFRTLLLDLILLTNKYNNLNNVIESYCKSYPNEVNKVSCYGWSPLYFTIFYIDNCIEIVKILLDNGADINIIFNYSSCLDIALGYNDLELIKLLLNSEVNVNFGVNYAQIDFDHIKIRLMLEYDAHIEDWITIRKNKKIFKEIRLLNVKN